VSLFAKPRLARGDRFACISTPSAALNTRTRGHEDTTGNG
jgi:hypothetical protein